ncbi:unnamed protein product, partial [Mesorhabditis spiculigera]
MITKVLFREKRHDPEDCVLLLDKYRVRLLETKTVPIYEDSPAYVAANPAILVVDFPRAKLDDSCSSARRTSQDSDSSDDDENGPLHFSFLTLDKLEKQCEGQTSKLAALLARNYSPCVRSFDAVPVPTQQAATLRQLLINKAAAFFEQSLSRLPIVIVVDGRDMLAATYFGVQRLPGDRISTSNTRFLGPASKDVEALLDDTKARYKGRRTKAKHVVTYELLPEWHRKRVVRTAAISITFSWDGDEVRCLGKVPADAMGTMSITPGWKDNRVCLFGISNELEQLLNICDTLRANDITQMKWPKEDASNDEMVIAADVQKVVEDCREFARRNGSDQGHMRFLDMTEQLWGVYRRCESSQQLARAIRLLFDSLGAGMANTIVHQENKTTLARLIRDACRNELMLPRLEGLIPIQILAEIGAEKLSREIQEICKRNDLVREEETIIQHLTAGFKQTTPIEERAPGLKNLLLAVQTMQLMKQYMNPSGQFKMYELGQRVLEFFAKTPTEQLDAATFSSQHCFVDFASNVFEVYMPSTWSAEHWYWCGGDREIHTITHYTRHSRLEHLQMLRFNEKLDEQEDQPMEEEVKQEMDLHAERNNTFAQEYFGFSPAGLTDSVHNIVIERWGQLVDGVLNDPALPAEMKNSDTRSALATLLNKNNVFKLALDCFDERLRKYIMRIPDEVTLPEHLDNLELPEGYSLKAVEREIAALEQELIEKRITVAKQRAEERDINDSAQILAAMYARIAGDDDETASYLSTTLDDPEAEPVAEEAAQEEPQAAPPAAAPATPPPPAAPDPTSPKSTATNSSRANSSSKSLAVSPASSTKNQPSAEDISVGSVKNEVSRAARKLVRLKPIKVSEKKLAKWGKIVEERLKRRKAAAEDPATKPLYTIDTPFPAADRSKEKPTDDSLPLNAAVMLDVLRGEVKLKTMPDDQVKLDPMAEVKDLRRKQPFFEYEVVYGNTVRSMINASESVNTRSTDRSEYSQIASSGSPRIHPDVMLPMFQGLWMRLGKARIEAARAEDAYRTEEMWASITYCKLYDALLEREEAARHLWAIKAPRMADKPPPAYFTPLKIPFVEGNMAMDDAYQRSIAQAEAASREQKNIGDLERALNDYVRERRAQLKAEMLRTKRELEKVEEEMEAMGTDADLSRIKFARRFSATWLDCALTFRYETNRLGELLPPAPPLKDLRLINWALPPAPPSPAADIKVEEADDTVRVGPDDSQKADAAQGEAEKEEERAAAGSEASKTSFFYSTIACVLPAEAKLMLIDLPMREAPVWTDSKGLRLALNGSAPISKVGEKQYVREDSYKEKRYGDVVDEFSAYIDKIFTETHLVNDVLIGEEKEEKRMGPIDTTITHNKDILIPSNGPPSTVHSPETESPSMLPAVPLIRHNRAEPVPTNERLLAGAESQNSTNATVLSEELMPTVIGGWNGTDNATMERNKTRPYWNGTEELEYGKEHELVTNPPRDPIDVQWETLPLVNPSMLPAPAASERAPDPYSPVTYGPSGEAAPSAIVITPPIVHDTEFEHHPPAEQYIPPDLYHHGQFPAKPDLVSKLC